MLSVIFILAFLTLFIHLYSTAMLSYSRSFNTVKACSLCIYIRMYIFTLDIFEKKSDIVSEFKLNTNFLKIPQHCRTNTAYLQNTSSATVLILLAHVKGIHPRPSLCVGRHRRVKSVTENDWGLLNQSDLKRRSTF